jgi:hypothetical protein
MSLVNLVADGLAYKMVGDGIAGKSVVGEQLPKLLTISGGFGGIGRGNDIEVVSPAGQFHAVIPHLLDKGYKFRDRQVGPLAGEECDGTWHGGWCGRIAVKVSMKARGLGSINR